MVSRVSDLDDLQCTYCDEEFAAGTGARAFHELNCSERNQTDLSHYQ